MHRPAQPAWRDYVADPAHGPLPALLLALTCLTGVVDAASILGLGRVFVANMTGNVVFIGFAIAGAPGFDLVASVVAMAGFLAGAAVGGALITRVPHRGRLLAATAGIGAALLAAATLLTALAVGDRAARDVAVALAAVGLGLQNAAVRKLAVPDLTTTVLTMTLTGIAADLRGGRPRVAVRRLLSVAAMAVGAVTGALLVLHVSVASALAVATVLAAVVAVCAALASRAPAAWQTR